MRSVAAQEGTGGEMRSSGGVALQGGVGRVRDVSRVDGAMARVRDALACVFAVFCDAGFLESTRKMDEEAIELYECALALRDACAGQGVVGKHGADSGGGRGRPAQEEGDHDGNEMQGARGTAMEGICDKDLLASAMLVHPSRRAHYLLLKPIVASLFLR